MIDWRIGDGAHRRDPSTPLAYGRWRDPPTPLAYGRWRDPSTPLAYGQSIFAAVATAAKMLCPYIIAAIAIAPIAPPSPRHRPAIAPPSPPPARIAMRPRHRGALTPCVMLWYSCDTTFPLDEETQ